MQEILRIVLPIVLVHACVLGIILFIVKKTLINDTAHAISRIKQVEAEVRKREEGIKREIEEHEKEFTRKKTEAEEALEKRRQESEKEVATIREKTMASAKEEGDRILAAARKNEEKMRQQIEQEMEEKAVDYGGEIFKLVFTEKMSKELNKEFTEELLDALEEIDSESITVNAADVSFTTSHPFDPDQKKRLKTLLDEKFKDDFKVEETVQEDLMAGMILKLGSLEIDGSLVNRFKEAVKEVKKSAHV